MVLDLCEEEVLRFWEMMCLYFYFLCQILIYPLLNLFCVILRVAIYLLLPIAGLVFAFFWGGWSAIFLLQVTWSLEYFAQSIAKRFFDDGGGLVLSHICLAGGGGGKKNSEGMLFGQRLSVRLDVYESGVDVF